MVNAPPLIYPCGARFTVKSLQMIYISRTCSVCMGPHYVFREGFFMRADGNINFINSS